MNRIARYLTVLFLAFGIVVRVRQWVFNRSQWVDEIKLSLNITTRGYGALLRPLLLRQGAPPGYLWTERTLVLIFGDSDRVLRLVSLAAGIASVVVFWRLAVSLLEPVGVACAVLLFATAPWLIYYSSEAKQYSCEVLATLIVARMTLWLCRGELTWRRAVVWGAVGAVACWFSYPAVLVLGAASVTVGVVVLQRRSRSEMLATIAGISVWFVGFATAFRIQLRQVGNDTAVHQFWVVRGAFAPRPLRFATTRKWLPTVTKQVIADPIGSTATRVVSVLLVAGLCVLVARRRGATLAFAIFGCAAFALAVGAAVADRYPFAERLALYLLPIVFVFVAASVDVACLATARRPGLATLTQILVVIVILVAFDRSVGAGFDRLRSPDTREESRPVLAYVAAHRQPADVIVAHVDAGLALRYYGTPLGLSAQKQFGLAHLASCDTEADLAPLETAGRFWVILMHHRSTDPPNSYASYLQDFETVGHIVADIRRPAAEAYLFETDRSRLARTDTATWPVGLCLIVRPT